MLHLEAMINGCIMPVLGLGSYREGRLLGLGDLRPRASCSRNPNAMTHLNESTTRLFRRVLTSEVCRATCLKLDNPNYEQSINPLRSFIVLMIIH